jgi:hypothetical protein
MVGGKGTFPAPWQVIISRWSKSRCWWGGSLTFEVLMRGMFLMSAPLPSLVERQLVKKVTPCLKASRAISWVFLLAQLMLALKPPLAVRRLGAVAVSRLRGVPLAVVMQVWTLVSFSSARL